MRTDTIIFDTEKLDAARLSKLWSRPELAKKAGVAYSTAWYALSGRRISLTRAKKIAKALGVPLLSIARIASSAGRTPEEEEPAGHAA